MKNPWIAKRSQADHDYLIEQGFHDRKDGSWDHITGYMPKDDKYHNGSPIYGATIVIENGTVFTTWSWGEEYIVAAIAKLDNLPSGKPKRVYTGSHDIWADKQRVFSLCQSTTKGMSGNYTGNFKEPKTKYGYFAVEIYYEFKEDDSMTPWLWMEYDKEAQLVHSEVLREVGRTCDECGKWNKKGHCMDCYDKARIKGGW